MRFQLLGPVQAFVADQTISLGTRQRRLVLAVLALAVNRPVPSPRLIDMTWPDRPPASGRGVIHTHISGIRGVLGRGAAECGAQLVSGPGGYELRCDPARIDAHQFRALVGQARDSTDDERRMALLDEALALWRGPMLAGTASGEIQGRLCRDFEEARLGALEDRVDARVRLGRASGLIDELIALTAEHPSRPRLTAALMLVLYEAGRAPEALDVYQRAARRLDEELGLNPPGALRALHLAILRDNPRLVRADNRAWTPSGGTP